MSRGLGDVYKRQILGMCDRIYTMNEGRITGEVSREEADQEVLMKLMTKEEVG